MHSKKPDDPEKIQNEAARWVARLQSGEVSDEERQAFSRWVRKSAAHRETFFKMREILAGVQGALNDPALAASDPPKQLSRPVALGLTACLVAALAFGFFPFGLKQYWLADYRTGSGQQNTIKLSDGSLVYLNTDSAVSVDLSGHARRIELFGGEAEFVVAHDPARPFIVIANEDSVTALGTDFSVRMLDSELRVAVFENAVQVKQKSNPLAVLEQGQQIRLAKNASAPEITQTRIEEARAWREGKLIFTARPLEDVIAEINRYRATEILLLAQDVGQNPVSGVFTIGDLDQAVQTIADTLALKTLRFGSVLTVLY